MNEKELQPITVDLFAMVCFLVLMQSGDGIKDKHYSYINEKKVMLKAGLDSFAFLDIYNMRKVVEWCREWGVEMPEKCAKYYQLEEEAFASLKDQGIEL